MQAPLVPVTLAFVSGILAGTCARLPLAGLVVVGTVSACVALWRWRPARSGVIALLLLWGCLGALRMSVWERHPDAGLTELLSHDPQPVQLHGFVVDDPVELFEPGEAHLAEGGDATIDPDRQVSVVALRHRKTTHGWEPICGQVRITIHSPRELLRYGDEILVEGEWSRVPAPGNPGQYDWRAALARKRIHGLLRVRPFDGLVVLRSGHHQGARGRNPPVPALRADPDGRRYGVPNARAFGRHGQGSPVMAAVFLLRARWEQFIRVHFSPRDAGLLLGLLLGQRAAIDEELKQAFVNTGTIHLLATQCTKLHRDSPTGDVTI